MALQLNEVFFTNKQSNMGIINLDDVTSEYPFKIGFSYLSNFSMVDISEIMLYDKLFKYFKQHHYPFYVFSFNVDQVTSIMQFYQKISNQIGQLEIPIIYDKDTQLSVLFNMNKVDVGDVEQRVVFILDEKNRIKYISFHDINFGTNPEEVVRVLLNLYDKYRDKKKRSYGENYWPTLKEGKFIKHFNLQNSYDGIYKTNVSKIKQYYGGSYLGIGNSSKAKKNDTNIFGISVDENEEIKQNVSSEEYKDYLISSLNNIKTDEELSEFLNEYQDDLNLLDIDVDEHVGNLSNNPIEEAIGGSITSIPPDARWGHIRNNPNEVLVKESTKEYVGTDLSKIPPEYRKAYKKLYPDLFTGNDNNIENISKEDVLDYLSDNPEFIYDNETAIYVQNDLNLIPEHLQDTYKKSFPQFFEYVASETVSGPSENVDEFDDEYSFLLNDGEVDLQGLTIHMLQLYMEKNPSILSSNDLAEIIGNKIYLIPQEYQEIYKNNFPYLFESSNSNDEFVLNNISKNQWKNTINENPNLIDNSDIVNLIGKDVISYIPLSYIEKYITLYSDLFSDNEREYILNYVKDNLNNNTNPGDI